MRGAVRRTALTRSAACALALAVLGACGGAARQARVPPVPDAPAEAAAAARAEIARRGPTAALYAELAAARVAGGELGTADADTRRSMALDGGIAAPHVVAARLAMASGDPESAALRYEEVALRWPAAMGAIGDAWAEALLEVARRRAAAGRPHAAAEVLQTLSARLPEAARRTRDARATIARAAAEGMLANGDGAGALEMVALARSAGAPVDALHRLEGWARLAAGTRAPGSRCSRPGRPRGARRAAGRRGGEAHRALRHAGRSAGGLGARPRPQRRRASRPPPAPRWRPSRPRWRSERGARRPSGRPRGSSGPSGSCAGRP
ncbi:MAG: hypothetical protein H6744_16040 [Deltaproteobacteria bacterium]|nr:hypothetical protein [Deltaproteobacteria bacterium]